MVTERKINQRARSYEIGAEIGRGTWGAVYDAKDQYGEGVAIKRLEPTKMAREQMQHRNWDGFRVMRNEAIKLEAAACSHVVPRRFEEDSQGEPYIVMPKYKTFLSDILRDKGERRYLGNRLDEKQLLKYTESLARGLEEVHGVLGRYYGDWKPDNLAVDEKGNLLFNDLGTTSMGRSVSPRDNIGFESCRAPESWSEDGKTDEKSDSFGFGSLVYRMFTGEYLLESVVGTEDFKHYIETHSGEEISQAIKAQVKQNIPQKWRKFIGRCTDVNPWNRFSDGATLRQGLERTIEGMDTLGAVKTHLRKWTLPIIGAAAFASLAAYNMETYEPQKLEVPRIQNFIRGELYSPVGRYGEKEMSLVSEEIQDLTGPCPPDGALFSGYEKYAKLSTKNRNVAYMAKCFRLAYDAVRPSSNILTDHQEENFWKWNGADEGKARRGMVGEYWSALSSSIEYGLNEANIPGVGVDLEDSLVLARLGEGTLKTAKKLSNSQDYKVYRDAKYAGGEPVINPAERKLLDTWLYYIQGDPDSIIMASRTAQGL